jgi:DNA polymerase elongation subunit (family B)
MLVASLNIDFQLQNVFPNANFNKIEQIFTTFSYFGKECHLKHIITTEPYTTDDSSCTIEYYQDERDALLAWTKLIRNSGIDVLTGYSIFNFDLKYLVGRARLLGCYDEFICLGKNNQNLSYKLVSGALGKKFVFDNLPDIRLIDLYCYIPNNFLLNNYQLQTVYNYFTKNKTTTRLSALEATEFCNQLLVYSGIYDDI